MNLYETWLKGEITPPMNTSIRIRASIRYILGLCLWMHKYDKWNDDAYHEYLIYIHRPWTYLTYHFVMHVLFVNLAQISSIGIVDIFTTCGKYLRYLTDEQTDSCARGDLFLISVFTVNILCQSARSMKFQNISTYHEGFTLWFRLYEYV